MGGDRLTPEQKAPIAPGELRALIASLLAGAASGSEQHWSKLVGEVELLPIAFNIHSNWRVSPTGRIVERDAVGKAVELVRQAHPYVHEEPSAE
jgi:hypothetical protein